MQPLGGGISLQTLNISGSMTDMDRYQAKGAVQNKDKGILRIECT